MKNYKKYCYGYIRTVASKKLSPFRSNFIYVTYDIDCITKEIQPRQYKTWISGANGGFLCHRDRKSAFESFRNSN